MNNTFFPKVSNITLRRAVGTATEAGNPLEIDAIQFKKEGNGVYAFVLKGNVTINGQELNTRDAVGISGADILNIQANTDAEFLLMDIPMNY